MAVFAYKALEATTASVVQGTVVADSPRRARDLLRQRGLTIQEVMPHQPASTGLWQRLRIRRSSRHQLTSFVRELSTLLGAGIPLLDGIDTIASGCKGAFRAALLLLRDRVSAGSSLAEAMREQPELFDQISIHMIEVGEHAGNLEMVLSRLAEFKERSDQLKSRLGTALLYPCIVFVTGTAVAVFLMTFVVPNLLSALVSAGRPLPWATQVVKTISDLLVQRWWMLLAALGMIVALGWGISRTPKGRRLWHRLQLHLPLIGGMIRKQAIVRLAVVVSALLKSGVPFVKALEIARRLVKNQVLVEALQQCEQAINGGRDIAKALQATDAFPPVMVQIFSVGQQSGRLAEMLDKLAADYDNQLTNMAQRLTAALEPVLILFLAVMVGFIAFATILPILEAGDVL